MQAVQLALLDRPGRGSAPTLKGLLQRAGEYLPPQGLDLVRDAYACAAEAHQGQVRKSGEPYLVHPLSAAVIIAELRLDSAAVAAALLHDVVEDCGVPLAHLAERFGPEVARLVESVTKLGQIEWSERRAAAGVDRAHDGAANAQAENLRKMFVAMAQDVRVILIKLADRLHNMRTLAPLRAERRRAIARETMEIYAPLANRLGIWRIKSELEDLSFRHLEPEAYRRVSRLVASRRAALAQYLEPIIGMLQRELEQTGIKADITGRAKHLFSVYQKMEKYAAQGKDFSQIHDVVALRVLVDELADCYTALGTIHGLWHPIPGDFDDYIANPRESGYQSLHTTVMCMAQPLEIQIRSHEMHRVAEYGIAAHWRYKEGAKRDMRFEEKIAWLRQLLEWHQDVRGAEEFVESVKADLFSDQVFVFTPKGEIKELPAGATPIDFAYRVHTDIGHRCIGAKVNGRLVPLNTTLHNGDVVEIMAAKTARGPTLDWLNPHTGYVQTSQAREKIRAWFRRQERAENVGRGRELLQKELRRLALKASEEEVAELLRYERVEDLLVALGSGDLDPHQIGAKLLTPERPAEVVEAHEARPSSPVYSSSVEVLGVGDLHSRVARCCSPVPGDDIIGFITRTRGVTVHRRDCPNNRILREPERVVHVDWGRSDQKFPVPVLIEAWDRVGLLRDVTTLVSGEGLNMSSVTVTTHDDQTAAVHITIETTGLSHLSRVLAKLEGIRGVIAVARASEAPLRRAAS